VRRLLHILLNTLTLLSLLLLLATSTLWIRGHYAAEGWIRGTEHHTFHFVSARNGIYIAWFKGMQKKTPSRWFKSPPSDFAQMFSGGWRFAGLAHIRRVYTASAPFAEFQAWTIPHWLLLIAATPIPLFRLLHSRASRRRKLAGLCSTCGYDLRATPGRCPECGGVAPI
jgi:hypothetical protein